MLRCKAREACDMRRTFSYIAAKNSLQQSEQRLKRLLIGNKPDANLKHAFPEKIRQRRQRVCFADGARHGLVKIGIPRFLFKLKPQNMAIAGYFKHHDSLKLAIALVIGRQHPGLLHLAVNGGVIRRKPQIALTAAATSSASS